MGQPYVGEIRIFAGNFPPLNWAFCNGQLLAISEFETLFNLIGTTYGGDGQQTFALPDLQGRVPIHQGTGPGLTTRVIGQLLGSENVTLTTQQMPAHTHTAPCSTSGASASPVNNFFAADGSGNIAPYSTQAPNALMSPAATSSVGGGQPHNNVSPVLGLSFIISLFGVFPSQN